MFIKLFKKKKKTTETIESIESVQTMTTEEILLGIRAIRKRSKVDKHYATFLNARVSKNTSKKLRKKGYIVKILTSEKCPAFKVSW